MLLKLVYDKITIEDFLKNDKDIETNVHQCYNVMDGV